VTSSVAIVALALAVKPPLSLVRETERLDLPPAAAGLRLEAHPFTREWILHLPPAAVPSTVFHLRGSSRICPEVNASKDGVVLRCTTSRTRVSIVKDAAGTGLLVHRLSVPSWRPEDQGPPLVAFDLERLNLGRCPGQTPELQGECKLAAGDLVAAKALFEQGVKEGPAPLAHLRLGDLALLDDDPDAAAAHWRMARTEAPWGRLAAARLCELEPRCLGSQAFEAVYDSLAVEHTLRPDLVLRRARMACFDGDLVNTARLLSAESGPGGACQGAMAWCRGIILLALQVTPPGGIEALTAYLDLHARTDGPLALELAQAAASQAERAGAPVFAANLLASITGTIPDEDLDPHLRRVAALYLQGRDRVRADEIVRYARSKLGEAAMKNPGWAALRKAVRAGAVKAARVASRPAAEGAPAAEPPEPSDPDLAGAQAAVSAARLALPPPAQEGAQP
jgi:hypothetical protein